MKGEGREKRAKRATEGIRELSFRADKDSFPH